MMRSWRTDRTVLFSILIGGILVGIILLLVGSKLNEGLWRIFLTQSGVALITASILGLATEWYLRERLFQEFEGRVAKTLDELRAEAIDAFHLQGLPSELLDVVRNTIIEAAVIERDRTAHYKMQVVPTDQGDALRAEISSSSIYENLTGLTQRVDIYEEGAVFDRPPTDEAPGFVRVFTETVGRATFPDFDLDKARGIGNFIARRDEGSQPIFRRPVQFPPKCCVRVTTLEVGYFALDNWDHYTVSKPTINMEISASVSGGDFKLSVKPDRHLIDAFHLSPGTERTARGSISGGLLPGQGMSLEWEPSDEG